MPPSPHVEIIRVRYGDTDQMGVVYYANYLRYFETARVEWLRANGVVYKELEKNGVMFPVVEAHVKYRAPARYDDLVEVSCVPTEVKYVTVRFTYSVKVGEAALCEGYSVHACVDGEGKPRRLPEWLRVLLGGEPE